MFEHTLFLFEYILNARSDAKVFDLSLDCVVAGVVGFCRQCESVSSDTSRECEG